MNDIASLVKCPYCGGEADLVPSHAIYGRNFGNAYICRPCDAYVGCHPNTTTPMGTLADRETRKWRQRAHEALDKLWKGNGASMTRTGAYRWLARQLNLQVEYTHIAHFDAARCREVVRIVTQHFGGAQ